MKQVVQFSASRVARVICWMAPAIAGAYLIIFAGAYPVLANLPWPQPLLMMAFGVVFATYALDLSVFRRFADPMLRLLSTVALAAILVISPLLIASEQERQHASRTHEELVDRRKEVRIAVARRDQEARAAQRELAAAQPVDRFSAYQDQVPFSVLQAIRQVDHDMQARLAGYHDAYQTALAAYPTGGPADWVVFRTKDQLQREIDAHHELYTVSRQLLEAVEGFFAGYEARLDALELEPLAERIALAEMQRIQLTWEQTNLLTLRQLDAEALAIALQALNLLQENWGTWQYSPRDQSIEFENPNAHMAFMEAIVSLDAIAEEMRGFRGRSAPAQ